MTKVTRNSSDTSPELFGVLLVTWWVPVRDPRRCNIPRISPDGFGGVTSTLQEAAFRHDEENIDINGEKCKNLVVSLVSSQLELFPDAEFRAAYDEAMKYGAKVVLGDSSAGPENLLLDASGALKVSNFGLSALPQQVRMDYFTQPAEHQIMLLQSVINNKGYDGAKADLWSCGVILFVLMAGYLPFEESNLMALYKKIFKADFSCPPWFSSSAKKLIKRILDPNPSTRITIAEVLENDWFKKGYKPHVFEHEDVTLDDVNSIFNEVWRNMLKQGLGSY
ncbi:CBL-interacting serine/threonine-protein kinase 23 [Orobanche minor]